MIIGTYLRLLDSLLAPFRRDMAGTLSLIDRTDAAAVKRAAPELWKKISHSRAQAVKIGNKMLTDGAREHGGQAYLPPPDAYTIKAVEKLLREYNSWSDATLIRAMERHVIAGARRQVEKSVLDPELENFTTADEQADLKKKSSTIAGFDALEQLDTAAEQEIKLAAESDAGKDEQHPGNKIRPVGWARVLTGPDNCGFCIMLASRGAVYSSSLAAQYWGGPKEKRSARSGRRYEAHKSRQTREAYRSVSQNKFHDGCDCMVVPVWDREKWPGKEEADKLRDFYDEVQEHVKKDAERHPEKYAGKSTEVILEEYLQQMRAQGRTLDIADKRQKK